MKHRDHEYHKLTRHHKIPKSRGGNDSVGNIVYIPQWFHELWHRLFDNMTVEEVQVFIFIVMTTKTSWESDQLKALREEVKSGVRAY